MLKQLVCRENASSDVDLSVRVQHALVEVDVCVAPEPHGLHEGSSRVCRMVVACPVVGTVAAGCAWARFTAFPVSLQSDQFFSVFRPSLAATRRARPDCTALPVVGPALRQRESYLHFFVTSSAVGSPIGKDQTDSRVTLV